jgi:hypothetical protein
MNAEELQAELDGAEKVGTGSCVFALAVMMAMTVLFGGLVIAVWEAFGG